MLFRSALLCFAAIVLIRNPKSLRISKADIPFLMVYGIAGFAFVQFFYFIAIKQLGVGIGLLFEFTAPVWILLWVRFIRKEHVRRRMFGAVAFTVTGLILISQMWSSSRMNVVGIVCGFIASVSAHSKDRPSRSAAGVTDYRNQSLSCTQPLATIVVASRGNAEPTRAHCR